MQAAAEVEFIVRIVLELEALVVVVLVQPTQLQQLTDQPI
jgi:hypothetical protein